MLTFIVPMSGRGRAFAEKGYTFPKPLIEIAGRPLVEVVVGNLTPGEPHRFVFICRREHLERYGMREVLELVSPGCKVISGYGDTGGALCTVLLGIEHIDPAGELVIANADQYITAPIDDFLKHARQ